MTTATTIPPSPATTSPSLDRLISAVRDVVQAESDAKRVGLAVADLLQPYLHFEGFLTAEQLEPDEIKYRQHILHVEPDGSFSIVALVWLPGQATPIHDHVSWCVVGVHRGEEHETVYEMAGGDAIRISWSPGVAISPAGTALALVPPGDIHHVANNGGTSRFLSTSTARISRSSARASGGATIWKSAQRVDLSRAPVNQPRRRWRRLRSSAVVLFRSLLRQFQRLRLVDRLQMPEEPFATLALGGTAPASAINLRRSSSVCALLSFLSESSASPASGKRSKASNK